MSVQVSVLEKSQESRAKGLCTRSWAPRRAGVLACSALESEEKNWSGPAESAWGRRAGKVSPRADLKSRPGECLHTVYDGLVGNTSKCWRGCGEPSHTPGGKAKRFSCRGKWLGGSQGVKCRITVGSSNLAAIRCTPRRVKDWCSRKPTYTHIRSSATPNNRRWKQPKCINRWTTDGGMSKKRSSGALSDNIPSGGVLLGHEKEWSSNTRCT